MDVMSYLLGKKAGSGGGGTEVVANPTLAGTEDDLSGLQVGDTKYKVATVGANPTLAGTEAELEGLEIDGTKYKVGGGGGIPTLETGTTNLANLDYGVYIVPSGANLQYRSSGSSFSVTPGGILAIHDNVGDKAYICGIVYGMDGAVTFTIHYGNTGGKDATHYTYSVPGTSA